MPCSHGYLSPRELVDKALEYGQPYFTMFGKTAKEILNALEFWDKFADKVYVGAGVQEQKQMTRFCPYCKCPDGLHYGHCVVFATKNPRDNQMTREEAISKADQTNCHRSVWLITSLETLGLLKFDKAPKKKTVEWVNSIGTHCWFSEGYDPNLASDIRWWKAVEEADDKPSPSMVIRSKLVDFVNQPMHLADIIVNTLMEAGYKIVPKD